ncbi:MAG: Uncharacterized MFS-type transporter, partial [uncultured Thermomicrobiales bacterium]
HAAPSRRARVVVLFTAAYFLSYFFRTANAVIAPDLSRELGLDAGRLGLMSSLFFAAFALAQLPLGPWLDRWGPRLVAPALMAVAVAGSLLFATAGSFAGLALGRALIGFGMAGLLPSAFKIVSLWFPPGRAATMSALVVGLGATGALVSATPLAWLNRAIGWRAVFVAVAAVVALSALTIARWARNTPPGVPWPGGGGAGDFRAVFTDRRFWRIVPLNLFFTGTILGVQGLWAGPYLFHVLRLPAVTVGNLLLLLALGAALGYAGSGWLADRLGVARVIAANAALFAGCQLLLALRPPLAVVAAVYLLFGLTGGFCIMTMAHARQIFPSAMTGQAVAAVNFFGIAGAFLLQWWMGLIIQRFPPDEAGRYPPAAYSAAFLFTATGTIATLLWYATARWDGPGNARR